MLVVEDDSPLRTMLIDLLQDAGYGVAEAVDGFQALEQLQEQRPDLIVLDLMLPGLSGWQFLERCRDQLARARIPVFVLSAIHGKGDYPASLGLAAWFTKPLDVQRFLDAVEQFVGPPRPRSEPPAASGKGGHPPRVLVIEDEPQIRDLITEYLEREGYSVEVAATIDEAEQRVTEELPGLILLDLMLPGRGGWDFLRQRQDDATLAAIPVLVLSAAPEDRLLDAKELGADGFLSKPFDLDVLSALVRSYAR